jgi:hypothetical protein
MKSDPKIAFAMRRWSTPRNIHRNASRFRATVASGDTYVFVVERFSYNLLDTLNADGLNVFPGLPMGSGRIQMMGTG